MTDDRATCPIETPDVPALITRAVHLHQAEHGVRAEPRVLANEVPIALVFNGISHAVMMGTPLDLEDFAIGFALSEGIIDSAADCYGVEVRPVAAAAAGLPPGMDGMEVKSIKKKMKDKAFAASVCRDNIRQCAEAGLELDEFLALSIKAMHTHSAELGLSK